MQKKSVIACVVGLISTSIWANEQQTINDRLNDSRLPSEKPLVQPLKDPSTPHASSTAQSNPTSISMTAEELEKHPELVIRAIQPALLQGNSDTLKLIFPIYQKLAAEHHHPLLTQWAEAILAKAEGNYRQSIRHYRDVLAQYPDNEPLRLQLAIALFANHELEAAEDQFQKLRAENLPLSVLNVIDDYLAAIRQKERWTFSGGMTYLHDPNINNAPKAGTTYGNWTPPKQESAEGIGLNLNIGKKWSWGDGFYHELRLNGNGKYYWDNRKYNEMSGRASVGLGFQNAKTDVAILPFMEQSFYAGGSTQSDSLKRFSKSSGAALELQHWLNSQWQLNSHYEYAEQRFTRRKHLNGNQHYLSFGTVYLANAKRHFFASLNYQRSATRDRDDSYFRRGITLGWQQEWSWGLSSRLSASMAQKRFKGAMPIFHIVQRNREYSVQASLWHRAVHYWGITPRLTYQATRTRSNHPFYSYDKHRFFLDFSKSF